MLCVGHKGMEGIIDLFANVSSIESITLHPVLLFEFTSQMGITRRIRLYKVIKQTLIQAYVWRRLITCTDSNGKTNNTFLQHTNV